MDLLSLTIGFVVGAATGAAGAYLGDKYTDKRRYQEANQDECDVWRDFMSRYPDLVAEMRQDVTGTEGHRRYFFLKSSRTMINSSSAPAFEYHTDVHPNILAAITELEEYGYVQDETTGNVPRYRMRETLVARLKAD